MTPEIHTKIDNLVKKNKIVLFMKGSRDFPFCGFSARAAQAVNNTEADYVDVNILDDADLMAALPEYANWPTFPQLYVNGELIGGCDIVCEMFESGELQDLVK